MSVHDDEVENADTKTERKGREELSRNTCCDGERRNDLKLLCFLQAGGFQILFLFLSLLLVSVLIHLSGF